MTVSVQIDGRVLQLFVTPGEAVHAGQRLLDFEISAAARSNYEQALSALKLARDEQTRTARLLSQQLATRDQLAQTLQFPARCCRGRHFVYALSSAESKAGWYRTTQCSATHGVPTCSRCRQAKLSAWR
jgi:hypothetical protein